MQHEKGQSAGEAKANDMNRIVNPITTSIKNEIVGNTQIWQK